MKLLHLKFEEIVIPEERQRQGLGEEDKKAKIAFEQLKSSIKANGILQPPGVTTSKELLYGFRRLMAMRDLGWTEIPVVMDPERDLTPLEKEVMELEENIQRLDLSWNEKEEAIAKINEIKRKQDPTWTQRKTGELVGKPQGKVSDAEMFVKMMKAFPELKESKNRKQAMSKAKLLAKTTIRKAEIQANPIKYEEVTKKVAIAKAEEIIHLLPDGFTNHIVTDGPFGIGYDKRPAGDGVHEAYEDSPKSYRDRTAFMASHLYRILQHNGFLIWFLAHDHLDWTREIFKAAEFAVDPIPLMWDRSDGRCYSVRPDRWFGKGYDIALHCIKGDPQMVIRSRDRGVHGSGNVFRYKPVDPKDKEQIVERPIELYQDIIECISFPGEKIVDFFGGSGKIAAAAASKKRDHWCCEMNPNHIPTIVNNIYNHTPQEIVNVVA